MRIFLVNRFYHPDQAATAQLATDVARQLASSGSHRVTVITSRAHYSPDPSAPSHRADSSIRVIRLPAIGGRSATLLARAADFAIFAIGAALLLGLQLRRSDIVIAKTDPPMLAAALLPAVTVRRAHLVNWLQDLFPETAERLGALSAGGPVANFLRARRDAALRRAAANVVIGEGMAAFVERRGASRKRIQIIENWAQDDRLEPVPRASNPMRTLYGYKPEDIVIGYSGNLGRAHDRTTMRRVIERRADPRLSFLFVGGGAGYDLLRNELADLRHVRFEPYAPLNCLAQSLSVPDLHWLTLEPALEGLIVPSKYYGIRAVARPMLFIGDPHGEIATKLATDPFSRALASGDVDTVENFLSLFADRFEAGEVSFERTADGHSRAQALSRWRGLVEELCSVR